MTDTKTWECPRCGQICHIPSDESPQLCLNCVLTAGEPAERQPETVLETPPVHENSSGEDREVTPDNRSRHRPIRRPFFRPARMFGLLIGIVGGFAASLLLIFMEAEPASFGPVLVITLIGAAIGFFTGSDITSGFQRIGEVRNLLNQDARSLMKHLGHRDEGIRMHAARKMGELGRQAEDALPTLNDLSERDPSLEVRAAAADALQKIQHALRGEENSPQTDNKTFIDGLAERSEP